MVIVRKCRNAYIRDFTAPNEVTVRNSFLVFYRTPFYGRSEEGTKDNILSYSYRPIFEYDIFSFAGEMFIDSCLRYPIHCLLILHIRIH